MQGPACMQKATAQTQCPHVARCQAYRRPWASKELRRTNACKCDSWLREDGRRPAASDTESSSSSVMGSICKAQRIFSALQGIQQRVVSLGNWLAGIARCAR